MTSSCEHPHGANNSTIHMRPPEPPSVYFVIGGPYVYEALNTGQ